MPGLEDKMADIYGGTPIEILMIEDNPADQRLAREVLNSFRIRNILHIVDDGNAALTFLRDAGRPRPDLILLDFNLPGKDGREVLAEIKSDPDLKAIPVAVLTGSDAEQDVLRAYNLQANCYITKPLDLDQLLTIMSFIDEFWLTIVRILPPVTKTGDTAALAVSPHQETE
jgi:CheY-like chemotaxis protein